MNFTAHTNAIVGNYGNLKAAHLNHDEDKYNSNNTIDYTLEKYNTNTIHVDDFDEWYHEKYEEPIIKYNAKQKRKDRKIENYDEHFEKRKNHGNRKNTEMYSPNRLLLMGFSDKLNNDELKKQLIEKFNFTEEQYYRTMSKGMELAVESFNEKYDNMTIVESFTHVNEGYPHAHCNLYAHGLDKDGKPFTDVNDALYEHYGRNKETDKGTTKRKSKRELWHEFRADVDENVIHKSMVQAVEEAYGAKLDGINFVRSGSELVGQQHDEHKKAKIMAESEAIDALNNFGAKLKAKESDLEAREQGLDEEVERRVNMAVKPREEAVAAREEAVAEAEQTLADDTAALALKREANSAKVKALRERERKAKEREDAVSEREQQALLQFEELKRKKEEDERRLLNQQEEMSREHKRLDAWRDKLLKGRENVDKHNKVAKSVVLQVLRGDEYKRTIYDSVRKEGLAVQDPQTIAIAVTESIEESKNKIAPRKLPNAKHMQQQIEKDGGPEF